MNKPLSIRAARENILLSLLAEDARSVGQLTETVSFTRHDCRVRQLLSGLCDSEHVAWRPDGDWRITERGLHRLAQEDAA